MQVSAKVDYALRALCVLARPPGDGGGAVKADRIAEVVDIPRSFLDVVLRDLRIAGLVAARRGPAGGHTLARDPAAVSVADVIRAVDGPLALVQGSRPEDLDYGEPARRLQDVWVAMRAAMRQVLDETTLADLVDDDLPSHVRALVAPPAAWRPVAASRRG